MSGTIVATPIFMPAIQALAPYLAGAAAGVAVTGSAVGLAASVKRLIDMQAAAAVEHQHKEREKLEAWLAYQKSQLQRMAEFQNVEIAFQESEKKLAALELIAPALAQARTAGAGPEAPGARSYMSLGKERATPEQIARMLEELSQIVTALPREFRDAENSPYSKLVLHKERIAGRIDAGESVLPSELVGFKETIVSTLNDFRKERIATHERMIETSKRLETSLNEVLFYEHLAATPRLGLGAEQAELAVLRAEVTALLSSGDVKMGALELVEKRLAVLKAAIDKQIVGMAYQTQLPESLTTHLSEMGYEIVEDFAQNAAATMNESTFRIPGGERLHVALHQNGQMAFEVLHERSARADGGALLTPQEIEMLHQQENKWCADFRELVRRLAGEGFPFTVNLERAVPMESVKVVVVETPDDILAADEEDRYRDEVKKQYLA